MKRLAVILALLLIGSFSTSTRAGAAAFQQPPDAQAPVVPEQARQRLEQLKERLKLTPEQIEQVRPILSAEMEKLKALRESSSGGGSRRDRLKMARELKRIQDDADDQLKKVLSKEQMNELKKIREERRQQLRDRAR
jgi:Spy/CpxP family protein refolding chaperone